MVFSSFDFVFLFLPIALLLFHGARAFLPFRIASAILVVSSLFFHAYWKPLFVLVIMASIVVNYALGHAIANAGPRAKLFTTLGIAANLLYLGFFKYTGFIIQNLNLIPGVSIPDPHIILALGISFFTFQQIAFLVDTYKERKRPGNFIDYCLFVTFFPHLIAGPIVHHKEMMPQFASMGSARLRSNMISEGIFLFCLGLAKKVLIADQLAGMVNRGFATQAAMPIHEAWLTSLGYTFQLYFDFAGYAAMALGLALLFGIRLPVNFNSPYKSASIQEFWRRWHITLSRFLRDYIYIPLGGNRVSVPRQYLNLFLTFFLGGIWHGAAWTFVVWGAAHGIATMVQHFWSRVVRITLPFWASWAITFLFVLVAWVFFRAPDFSTAIRVLASMVDVGSAAPLLASFTSSKITLDLAALFPNTLPTLTSLTVLFVAGGLAFFAPSAAILAHRFRDSIWLALFALALFLLSVANMENVNEFLYFDF